MKWWNVVNLRVLVETGKKCFGRMIYLNGHVEFETSCSKISLSFTSQTCGVLKSTWTEREFVEAFLANSVLVAKMTVTFVYVDDTACSNTFGLPVMNCSQQIGLDNCEKSICAVSVWHRHNDEIHWWLMKLRRNVNRHTWYKQERWAVWLMDITRKLVETFSRRKTGNAHSRTAENSATRENSSTSPCPSHCIAPELRQSQRSARWRPTAFWRKTSPRQFSRALKARRIDKRLNDWCFLFWTTAGSTKSRWFCRCKLQEKIYSRCEKCAVANQKRRGEQSISSRRYPPSLLKFHKTQSWKETKRNERE